jgi:hypothetical protein
VKKESKQRLLDLLWHEMDTRYRELEADEIEELERLAFELFRVWRFQNHSQIDIEIEFARTAQQYGLVSPVVPR